MNYIKGILWGLLICVALTLLCGCKTKYVAVPQVSTRDSLVTRWQTDSVFQRDSVYIKEYVKGDTVYHFRYRTKMMYRDRTMRDTVCVVRTDTVTICLPNAGKADTGGFDARPILIGLALIIALVPLIMSMIDRRKDG